MNDDTKEKLKLLVRGMGLIEDQLLTAERQINAAKLQVTELRHICEMSIKCVDEPIWGQKEALAENLLSREERVER